MKTVDTIHYFPDHISNIEEFKRIAAAYDTELRLVWMALGALYNNQYFDTMDEATCARWEKLMGIIPTDDDTLASRRMTIKGRWTSSLPYTRPKFRDVLNSMVGDHYRMAISVPEKTLDIGITLAGMSKVDYVYEIMRAMAPADMEVTVRIVYNKWQRFLRETWGTLQPYTWGSLHEDARWED